MKAVKWILTVLGGVGLGILIALGILYLKDEQEARHEKTSPTEVSVKQEETKSVDDKAQSDLEVNLARARGYLSEGNRVYESAKVEEQQESIEKLLETFRSGKDDSRLKADSSGISLRYAVEKQGYKLKSDSFEVWSTKDFDVVNILFVLTGGKNDDMYLVLSYEKTANTFHILYLYGGKPDTFG